MRGRGRVGKLRKYRGNIHMTVCKTDRSGNSLCDAGSSNLWSVTAWSGGLG